MWNKVTCSDARFFGKTDAETIQNAINYAKENGFNTVILDTAGRLQIDTDMMAELLLIDRVFHPNEKLLFRHFQICLVQFQKANYVSLTMILFRLFYCCYKCNKDIYNHHFF